jgi:hypothetical protein
MPPENPGQPATAVQPRPQQGAECK